LTGKANGSAFKAIADPTRREILRLLRKEEMTAGELAERFDMTKPTMSHHFRGAQGGGSHHEPAARDRRSGTGSIHRCWRT
jgi:DNA-binding transcriptional ArsR family regulator